MADQIQIVPAGGNGPMPDPYDPSKDPKHKANSGDQYGYWPDTERCASFAGKMCMGRIARFKRHLAGASTKGRRTLPNARR
jgi:hypothetical protein